MILDMIHATNIDTFAYIYRLIQTNTHISRLHIYWIVIYILFFTLGPIHKSLKIIDLVKMTQSL